MYTNIHIDKCTEKRKKKHVAKLYYPYDRLYIKKRELSWYETV